MSKSDNIPLVDLAAAHHEVEDQIRTGFGRVLRNTSFILGDEVSAFEKEYASFIGTRHCVGVSNGTDALELSLRAVGVGLGDEVIIPVNTFIATALAVVRTGARPVFVDCDEDHLLIDPGKIIQRINERTAAIVPVHLFGQMAPIAEILEISEAQGIPVIEDAAQAQGAACRDGKAGTFGIAAATSFYPGKNLGAYGDAGAVNTDNEEVALRLERLRNYGSRQKYHHPEVGFNCRLDALQAVVLRAKLLHLEDWNAKRSEAAATYDALFAEENDRIRPVSTVPGNRHVYHLYVIRVAHRAAVLAHLHAAGIGAGIHYPKPLHQVGAFAEFSDTNREFPIAEHAAEEILSLPIYPHITTAQQERVATELKRALR